MLAVHQALRDTLAAGSHRVSGVVSGDDARVELIADYYDNILWFLDVHHDGEEALVFPKLRERVSTSPPLMEAMIGQHNEVVGLLRDAEASLAAWRAGDTAAQPHLAAQLQTLHDALVPHLDTEESEVLPLCAANLSPEEWGALPGHALSQYSGDKVWLIIGLIMERRTPDGREAMMAVMPPPVARMWTGMGRQAFEDLAARVG
jgi:hemerythrin-like domain-containing protein